MINSRQLSQVILSIGFISLSLSLYGISKSYATGYEVSIYSNLSLSLWVLLLGSLFCGICVTVYSLSVEVQNYFFGRIGILLVVLTNCVLLLLPLFKGYALYGRWDALTHVGFIVDLVKYGYISNGNVYPVTHVYLASVQHVCNIPIANLIMYLPAVLLIYYVLFTYILAKETLYNQKSQLLSVLTATVLLTSYSNYQVLPTVFSFYVMPLLFYLYFKRLTSKRVEVRLLLVLLVVLFPFFHPLTSLLAILFFLMMDLCIPLCSKFILKGAHFKFNSPTLLPSLISVIIFISWLSNSSNYSIWFTNISNMYYYFKGESSILVASSSISDIFERMSFQITDIIELYIKMYGHITIFSIVAGIASIVIIKRTIQHSNEKPNSMFVYQSLFLLMCVLILINLFKTIFSFGIWRLIGVLCIIVPILVSFILWDSFLKDKKEKAYINARKSGVLLIIVMLTLPSIGGILALYPSPWVYQMNQQVTHMDVCGMKWYYGHKNAEILDLNIRSSFRFADFILGVQERQSRTDIRPAERMDTSSQYKLPKSLVPNHFNYLNYSTFGSSLNADFYIPLQKYDQIFYTQMYSNLEVFNSKDFEQFQFDRTVESVYSNGELMVYYAHAKN